MKNSSIIRKDFFVKGLVFSWVWHLFWVFCVTPVVKDGRARPVRSRSVFLGPILRKVDVAPRAPEGQKQPRVLVAGIDAGREDYFSALPKMQKPKARQARPRHKHIDERSRAPKASTRHYGPVAFGLKDFTNYVSHVDFNELKRVSDREDISSYLDLAIVVGPGGLIKDIRKVSGSGDPALDLYIMRKLKTAVFRDPGLFEGRGDGEQVMLRFKIKE